MDAQHKLAMHLTGPARQKGATALEFALVFPVVFLLFYGTLTFALIFTVRMGLQHAAEEGVRSAVVYRLGEANAPGTSQIALREATARQTAQQRANWITRWADIAVDARICQATSIACIAPTPAQPCGRDPASACTIRVTVSYPYATRPILPSAFGLPVPTTLVGEASLMLDGRMLGS